MASGRITDRVISTLSLDEILALRKVLVRNTGCKGSSARQAARLRLERFDAKVDALIRARGFTGKVAEKID